MEGPASCRNLGRVQRPLRDEKIKEEVCGLAPGEETALGEWVRVGIQPSWDSGHENGGLEKLRYLWEGTRLLRSRERGRHQATMQLKA